MGWWQRLDPFAKERRELQYTHDLMTLLDAAIVLQGWRKAVENGDDHQAQRVITEVQALVDATEGRLELITQPERIEVRFAGGVG